ncbi:MAG: AzlD domain-containing protein [Lachnospiraceae bacterium]|nr:AzlD domain-containing protein [Lachnospiraceae bacterium]
MNTWTSLILMIVVIYSVRMLPMILLRRSITNTWLRSFLYYVPYVTLAVMTFPAIIRATESPVAGVAALLVGLVTAWVSGDLFTVAVSCCAAVILTGLFI